MKKTGIVSLFAILFILIIGGGSFWLYYKDRGPVIYPRKNDITIEDDYQFQTQYGDVNNTFLSLLIDNDYCVYYENPNNYAWAESYIQEGLVEYFDHTRNQTILNHLLYRIEHVMNNSDANGDGVLGFGSERYEGYYVHYIVWDGKILRPIAHLANIIKSDPILSSNTTLIAQMESYIEICEEIIRRWNNDNWRETQTYGYYVSPPENKTAIFNRINALGRLIIEVYQFTQNNTYLTHIGKMAQFFKDHLIDRQYYLNGITRKMYLWGYDWNGTNSDVSHACIDVRFAVKCHELGIVFNSKEMELFANTFFEIIFRGTFSDVIFADYLNGKVHDGTNQQGIRRGWLSLYSYYDNPHLADYIIFKSVESLIDQGTFKVRTMIEALAYLLLI
ncbi:MAG: hypothetical protein FK733_15120 [Asgard group archaeon]|nr:hypothetical protein [Asgard group archaeon]